MSRNLSLAALTSALAESTPDPWIPLLRIKNAQGVVLFRFAVNTEPIVSLSQTYEPFFVDVQLGDEAGDKPPEPMILIDAVDQRVIAAIDGLEEAPLVDIEFVLGSAREVPVLQMLDLKLGEANISGAAIAARLSGPDYLNQQVPGILMDPTNTPAIFQS